MAAVALSGCSQADNSTSPEKTFKVANKPPLTVEKPVQKGEAKQEQFVGEVVFLPMEGGFYGIVDAKGRKWLPLGLDKSFKRPGLKVEVQGSAATDVMTTQQWGTPFHITDIKVLDDKDVGGQGERY
ncbi:hypothetical protein [Gallaecimonas mangrovi]|uniref:hypothetical protein n=1 Tax=Gallaecimonas mangrovi TaxID=2291597 RepID=UPI000E1FF2D5|nr:hypothetical protein [Gallaecimonas mangrovi]